MITTDKSNVLMKNLNINEAENKILFSEDTSVLKRRLNAASTKALRDYVVVFKLDR